MSVKISRIIIRQYSSIYLEGLVRAAGSVTLIRPTSHPGPFWTQCSARFSTTTHTWPPVCQTLSATSVCQYCQQTGAHMAPSYLKQSNAVQRNNPYQKTRCLQKCGWQELLWLYEARVSTRDSGFWKLVDRAKHAGVYFAVRALITARTCMQAPNIR